MSLNQNSIFTGTTAGLLTYGAAYYLTPASMGYINFTISSFLANYISAIPAVLLGYALPALAAIGVGILLAAAHNTFFGQSKQNPPALNIDQDEKLEWNAPVLGN